MLVGGDAFRRSALSKVSRNLSKDHYQDINMEDSPNLLEKRFQSHETQQLALPVAMAAPAQNSLIQVLHTERQCLLHPGIDRNVDNSPHNP